jgi:hypothetical protein
LGRDTKYSGWLQVRASDFPSHGVSHILPLLQGRQQDALSTLERTLLLLLNYWGAKEVREQKPLALDINDPVAVVDDLDGNFDAPGSVEIAASRGWQHPRLSNGQPRRMSTDVLVDDGSGESYAFYVRYVRDLPPRGSRQWELLEIARVYWTARSVRFFVFTEEHVDAHLRAHLVWAFVGLGTFRHPGEEFIQFLRGADFQQPLIRVMRDWVEGPLMGIARFKSALVNGVIEVCGTGRRPRLITRPWDIRFVTEPSALRLKRFAASLEVLHD